MNSTAHTAGPWTCFYKPKYDEWHVSLPVAGSSMKLALCPDGIQSENREADAHLIAAAPEMLAALKLCIEYDDLLLRFKGPAIIYDGDVKQMDEAYDRWVLAARAAIAKAVAP